MTKSPTAGARTRAALTLALAALLAGCAGPTFDAPLTRELVAEHELFNGTDLSGWVVVNGAPSTWTVRDGLIVCSGIPTGVMRTERMWENFELEVEYRHMTPGGNAGIFVWSDPLTAPGKPFTRSTEVQVMDGVETEDYTSHGDVFPIHGASFEPDRPHPNGWMRSLPSEKRAKPSPEWNRYVIRCVDGTIDVALNGKRVSGGTQTTPRKGYLCLEAEGSEVHFRGLRLRELSSSGELAAEHVASEARGFRSLYNGVDLSGWHEEEGKQGGWHARDWILEHDGTGSHLWSDASFRDFELIADWRWIGERVPAELPIIDADGVARADIYGDTIVEPVPHSGDSGIYLRGSPKSQVNIWCWPVGSGEVYGYRVDELLPAEVRAGVTPSRPADAPIGEWNRFHVTLRGDRLTVVLNGVTVIDGAQLPGIPEEGPLALQHHGWPIQFANLYVRELD